jgi:4-hydroxythreonine-4-phosphate dehydrogenase
VTAEAPVLISMGEPAGIGPEVAVKAWAALQGRVGRRALHLLGSRKVFENAASICEIDTRAFGNSLVETSGALDAPPGKPSPKNAEAVTGAIEEGVKRVLRGDAAALVTAPIHKAVLTEAGFGFPGHTEFLASLSGTKRAVMMLASDEIDPPLRVVSFSVHIPLKEAVSCLDADAIVETAMITLAGLKRDFAIAAPRLAMAGLNPHAGEDGTMGREDADIVGPAAGYLRATGHDVRGPLPADTLFHEEARKNYDAVLCMYHDQALIPIKTLAFWSGVNVTLGLPIVRTSPDHGTALDIAGKGVADSRSMVAAIRMAAEIADRRGL